MKKKKIEGVRSLDNFVEKSSSAALDLLLSDYHMKERQNLSYLSHFCLGSLFM